MRKFKSFLTTKTINDAKKLILDGWSPGYAMALLGFKSSHQEHLYRNSQAYRDLINWYKKTKGERNARI